VNISILAATIYRLPPKSQLWVRHCIYTLLNKNIFTNNIQIPAPKYFLFLDCLFSFDRDFEHWKLPLEVVTNIDWEYKSIARTKLVNKKLPMLSTDYSQPWLTRAIIPGGASIWKNCGRTTEEKDYLKSF